MIQKTPIKINDNSKLKWAFSTNPSVSLLSLHGKKSPEEVFLIKLIEYIKNCSNEVISLILSKKPDLYYTK